jgi:dephospho-CoA kinase
VFVVGLTGGIGTGKSTFAALLAERGAQVIDADLLGRDAVTPGRPAWKAVIGQFGNEVLAAGSMKIDRKRLAAIVFSDPKKLAALNAIVHPVIFKGVADELDRLRETDTIVVLDAALIIETGLDSSCDALLVVDSDDEERIRRLQRDRGMSFADVRARMGAQADRIRLLDSADIVVSNNGTVEELAREADRVWAELVERRNKKAAP